MRSSQAVSAALAVISMTLLVSACASTGGSSATPGATCSGSGPRVEVVVELGNHHVVNRCVNFKGASISGATALHRSGIEFAIQHFGFGDGVCQIDKEPKSYTTCFPSGQPYWALFTWSGRGKWKAATTGISEVALKSGEALGWRYDPSSGAAPPPPLPSKP